MFQYKFVVDILWLKQTMMSEHLKHRESLVVCLSLSKCWQVFILK